ncbi:LIC12162 family protein [Candidatus Pseudothioglobus singularis]|nr:LIC12162 family protein [Candidatus Pseudothioglobus singularis]
MKEQFLVTTALEDTWPKNNQPVLFLGEWCRLYSRKNLWEKMEAKVLPYHWDDRVKLYEDFNYLNDLFERLLIILSSELNKIHGVDHTIRYWRILIGPWLMRFLSMLYDRWLSVNAAISLFPISGTSVLDIDELNLIPQSMEEFSNSSKSELWNHGIYSLILKYLNLTSIITIKPSKEINNLLISTSSRSMGIMSHMKEMISTVSTFFLSNNSYFIITPYISLVNKIKLQLKLNQIPVIYPNERFKNIAINDEYRKWNLSNFECKNEFEKFAITIIPLQMPVLYLEGYKAASEKIKNSRLPKKPKLIWTSNSFYMNDQFKLWAAEKVEEKVPLVIGQHGGNYGSAKFSTTENHELKICDYYLSWGWKNNESKVIPVGIFMSPLKRKIKNFSTKKILFTILATHRYSGGISSMPVSSQWIQYMDDQIEFYGDLPSHILNDINVRLYHDDSNWSQYDRLKDVFPESNIDEGKLDYNELLVNARLAVHGWNSTTYLESMASDIPTVIFWKPKYFELREEAREFFDKLKEVGIYHETPLSASKHIKNIWNEEHAWWNLPDVVSARNNFIEQYARPSNIVNRLNSILRKIASDESSLK